MTIIEQIKAEIERRITDNTFGAKLELIDILTWLDTLESEKPMNQGLDKEIEEISINVPCSEFTHESEYIDLLDWLKEQFTYFYDLGCRRTAEKYDELEYDRQMASGSSEIPKDLLDAQVEIVEKLIGENNNDGANAAHPFACEYVVELLQKAVSAGAKWQADHAPLPEDTVLFQKGVEEGKRLMMEGAVKMYRCYDEEHNLVGFSVDYDAPGTYGNLVSIIVKED